MKRTSRETVLTSIRSIGEKSSWDGPPSNPNPLTQYILCHSPTLVLRTLSSLHGEYEGSLKSSHCQWLSSRPPPSSESVTHPSLCLPLRTPSPTVPRIYSKESERAPNTYQIPSYTLHPWIMYWDYNGLSKLGLVDTLCITQNSNTSLLFHLIERLLVFTPIRNWSGCHCPTITQTLLNTVWIFTYDSVVDMVYLCIKYITYSIHKLVLYRYVMEHNILYTTSTL